MTAIKYNKIYILNTIIKIANITEIQHLKCNSEQKQVRASTHTHHLCKYRHRTHVHARLRSDQAIPQPRHAHTRTHTPSAHWGKVHINSDLERESEQRQVRASTYTHHACPHKQMNIHTYTRDMHTCVTAHTQHTHQARTCQKVHRNNDKSKHDQKCKN
jgi:hypothetical protein